MTFFAVLPPASGYTLCGPKWPNKKAVFYINTQYGPSGSLTAFQNALTTWSEVDDSAFEFSYGGTTASHAYGTNNGENIADFGTLSSNYWGYTYYWYSSGNFLDADVRLNRSKPWGTSPAYDVETVALHEFGHALGLGHSSNSAAIMYYQVDRQQRTLHQDDINGLVRLYPAPNRCPLLYAATLNSDNRTDLVYVSRKGTVFYTVDMAVWTRIGGNRLKNLAIGDFNGDNLHELAGINPNQKVKFAGDNATELDEHTGWLTVGDRKFKKVLSGDFNGDGTEELAGITAGGKPRYIRDNGTTWDEDTEWFKIGDKKLKKIYRGDFNGDGIDELIGINENGKVRHVADNSSRWDEYTQWVKTGSKKFKKLATGDFDGDSTDEIVGINTNNKVRFVAADSSQWGENTPWTRVGDIQLRKLVAGDFDGDGTDELAGINMGKKVKHTADNSSRWDENTQWSKVGLKKFKQLAVGDFNGDGKQDLAGINNAYHVLYTTDNSTTWDETTEWIKLEKP